MQMGNGCGTSTLPVENNLDTRHNKRDLIHIGSYSLNLLLVNKHPEYVSFKPVLPWEQFGLPWTEDGKYQQVYFEPDQFTSNGHLPCSVSINGRNIDLGDMLKYKPVVVVTQNDVTEFFFSANILQVGTNDKFVRFVYDKGQSLIRPVLIRISNAHLHDTHQGNGLGAVESALSSLKNSALVKSLGASIMNSISTKF